MNRRGKRLTLGVMAVGLAVVLVLGIAHWDTVRDHVEAWHFQLTRETETIDPAPGYCGTQPDITIAFCIVAGVSGRPVIFEKDPAEITMDREKLVNASAPDMLEMLRGLGYHILEQRFPRRAYVVIRDERAAEREAVMQAIIRSLAKDLEGGPTAPTPEEYEALRRQATSAE